MKGRCGSVTCVVRLPNRERSGPLAGGESAEHGTHESPLAERRSDCSVAGDRHSSV